MSNESKIVLANKQNGTTTEIIDNNISSASKKFYLPNTGGNLLTSNEADSRYMNALSGDQTINGIKTFNVPPLSATNPTAKNQVANKAYVDSIAASKPGYVTKTIRIGSNEQIKDLNEFRLFAIDNHADFYILALTSDIVQTDHVIFRGVNLGFNSTDYSITFKNGVDFHFCNVSFGKMHLKMESEGSMHLSFLCSTLYINGDFSLTDTTSTPNDYHGSLRIKGGSFTTGGADTWTINTTSNGFTTAMDTIISLTNIRINGSIPSGEKLFLLDYQGILMTLRLNTSLTVTDIAPNQLTNKGIWINK